MREDADLAAASSEVFWLWPDHEATLRLWLQLQTQWRRGGMDNVATGLDYAAVLAALGPLGVARQERVARFGQLQIMEGAALDVWAQDRRNKG